MRIADRKQADDVIALVHAIEPAGRAGVPLSALAARVPLAPKRIERLIRRHTDYFVTIAGEQRYALNRFDKFGGSAELIIADVEQSYRRFTRMWATVSILIVLAALLSLAPIYLRA